MKEYKGLMQNLACLLPCAGDDAGARSLLSFYFLPPGSAREFGAKDIHMLDLRRLGQQIRCICLQGDSDRTG